MFDHAHLVRAPLLGPLTVVTALALVACQSPAGSGPATTPRAVMVGSATSSLGAFLTGPNGKTLYIHAGDSMNTSTCSGACISSWPVLTVATGQQPIAGPGVTGHLGTFSRSDGSVQVTYNGLPLYYWQGDTKAGETTGQGINGFTVALVTASASANGSPAPSASSSKRHY